MGSSIGSLEDILKMKIDDLSKIIYKEDHSVFHGLDLMVYYLSSEKLFKENLNGYKKLCEEVIPKIFTNFIIPRFLAEKLIRGDIKNLNIYLSEKSLKNIEDVIRILLFKRVGDITNEYKYIADEYILDIPIYLRILENDSYLNRYLHDVYKELSLFFREHFKPFMDKILFDYPILKEARRNTIIQSYFHIGTEIAKTIDKYRSGKLKFNKAKRLLLNYIGLIHRLFIEPKYIIINRLIQDYRKYKDRREYNGIM